MENGRKIRRVKYRIHTEVFLKAILHLDQTQLRKVDKCASGEKKIGVQE